jgi:hypothetical protein
MTQSHPYGSDWFKFLEGAFTANQLPLNFQHRRRRRKKDWLLFQNYELCISQIIK